MPWKKPVNKSSKTGSHHKTIVNKDPNKPGTVGILKHRGVLIILSENKIGKSFVLKKPETIIGRSITCDITIDDALLSREHCKISMDENGMFYVEDLSPTNPSFVNSKKVTKKMMIYYADRIVTGSTIFRFFLEEGLK